MRTITPHPVGWATAFILFLATLATTLALAPAAQAVPTVTIYNNSLRTPAGLGQVTQFGKKEKCERDRKAKALRVKVGAKTRECFFSLPVIGRDLQAVATARLFKETPKGVLKRAWMAVNLRQAADGSRYQLFVVPRKRSWSLRKVLPDGTVENFGFGKDAKVINGPAMANRITLRAFNGVGKLKDSQARLVAIVNGKRLKVATDNHGHLLKGRDTTLSIGSRQGSRGASGSFMNARVAMPDPY